MAESNSRDREHATRSDVLALHAPPHYLLDSPLEYFLADHLRHRAVCGLIRNFIKEKCASRVDADIVIAFLNREIPLHRADEEDDLFPALRRRARPEDELGEVLAGLRVDDLERGPRIEQIVAALSRMSGGDSIRLERRVLEVMQIYVAREHRHIAIENGVVLAIAGVRLNRSDIRSITRGMKARRGISNP